MGTLIKKGLVVKESSPAKYRLTDAGALLAHRLEATQGDISSPHRQRAPVGDPQAWHQDRG